MNLFKDRVLVEFLESSERTQSGLIIIPQEARDPAYTGKVLEIGPEQFEVKVGDIVVFSRYAGIPMRSYASGPERAVLDGKEILAVVESEEEKDQLIYRTTVALDARDVCGLVRSELKGEMVYAHYNHESQSFYLTFEWKEV